jgi:uncharacterized protein
LRRESGVDALAHAITRREFLGVAASAAAFTTIVGRASAASQPPVTGPTPIATRVLGRTGREVTILGIGLGALGDGGLPEDQVCSVLTEALDLGITYVDTAPIYGKTQSYVGPIIEARRDGLFLTSKIRPPHLLGPAREQLERALRDLRTDAIDLVHIHQVADHPFDSLEQPDGVLTVLRKAKEEGLVRHIGASGHHTPRSFLPLLEAAPDLDVIMVPVNVVDRHLYAFESEVIPSATARGTAVIAMKLLGGVPGWQYGVGRGRLVSADFYEPTIRYALGHEGVTTGIVGFSTSEELRMGVEVARRFRPLEASELAALEEPSRQLAAEWGAHFGPQ